MQSRRSSLIQVVTSSLALSTHTAFTAPTLSLSTLPSSLGNIHYYCLTRPLLPLSTPVIDVPASISTPTPAFLAHTLILLRSLSDSPDTPLILLSSTPPFLSATALCSSLRSSVSQHFSFSPTFRTGSPKFLASDSLL